MKNVELLTKVRDQIRDHPETHDQTNWGKKTPCGTAFCVAGHAIIEAGLKPRWDTIAFGGAYTMTGFEPNPDGLSMTEQAEQILDLECTESNILFNGEVCHQHILEMLAICIKFPQYDNTLDINEICNQCYVGLPIHNGE